MLEVGIMSEMGSFRITIAVEHPGRRGELRSIDEVLVDTSSEFTWVPIAVLEQLGIPREGTQRFIVADGRVLERDIGIAIVHAEGTLAPDWVVFAHEGDMVLLGAHSLEGLNLRVDARAKRLVSAGPIVTAAA
jgi:predicted aspartyl protease